MITNRYSFSYDSADNDDLPQYPAHVGMSKSVQIDQDASWPMVVREFTQFLSAVYGYDVTEKVFIKIPSWTDEEEYVPLNEYE
jgi:hypothetical protein